MKEVMPGRLYSETDINDLLREEFVKFERKWHGVLYVSDLQSIAKFIQQVKDELNKPVVNPA